MIAKRKVKDDSDDEVDVKKASPIKKKSYLTTTEPLIGVPSGNRVEDRLMEHGKNTQDKKLLKSQIQQAVHAYRPALN